MLSEKVNTLCVVFALASFVVSILLAVLQRYVASFVALFIGLIVLSYVGEKGK
ncbi:MAG: hypothetical protein QXQ73_04920 [Desulfurococcaceae archaeon]